VKPTITAADVATALRFPTRAVFHSARAARQLAIVAAARRRTSPGLLAPALRGSRVGAVLDPIADKCSWRSRFRDAALRGLLEWYEVIGVLLRDLVAALDFWRRGSCDGRTALPARRRRQGGDDRANSLTLVAAIAESPHVRRLAWPRRRLQCNAIWDYDAPAARGQRVH